MPARTYIGTGDTMEGALAQACEKALAKDIPGEPYKTSWEITLQKGDQQYQGKGAEFQAAYDVALAEAGIADRNVAGYQPQVRVHATFEAPADVASPAGASMRTGVKGGSLTSLL